MLNGLNEIVCLHDCTVGVHLHHIFVYELCILNRKTGHGIYHIDLAVGVAISNIIEEDVLSAVVCLVNEKRLAT